MFQNYSLSPHMPCPLQIRARSPRSQPGRLGPKAPPRAPRKTLAVSSLGSPVPKSPCPGTLLLSIVLSCDGHILELRDLCITKWPLTLCVWGPSASRGTCVLLF